MGNQPSTSSKPSTPESTRTTPLSISLLHAASPSTLALRPPSDALTNNSPSRQETESFAQAFARRGATRTAYTLFSCGRNLFIPYAGSVLVSRGIITSPPGTSNFEDVADQVWNRVVMREPMLREFWEEAAREAKAAMDRCETGNLQLLEARGLPERKAEYEAWAVMAVEELVQQVLEDHAVAMEGEELAVVVEESESSFLEIEEGESQATGPRSTAEASKSGGITSPPKTARLCPSIILTPPATPVNERRRHAPVAYAASAPITPESMPRRQRDSMHSIAESLYHEPEEAFTPVITERLTPAKAKIVQLKS